MRDAVSSFLSGSTPAPPAVRRPTFAIQFGGGSGAGSGGGIGGALSSAISTTSASVSADPWTSSVSAISIEVGLAPFADVVEIDLAAAPGAPQVAADDQGQVSLGYDDATAVLVFTGQIDLIRRGVHGATRLVATNAGAVLSRSRVNQSYLQQTAGAIVQDLASRAGVEIDHVEDGITFPFYVVDDRQSAYAQIAALARRSGFLAYVTPDGKLNFAPYAAGDPVQTFTYGVDVLAVDVGESKPLPGSIAMTGEGAAGSQGADAWSWPLKDPTPVQAQSGTGDVVRYVEDSSLRSADAVRQAASSLADAAQQLALTGRALVAGAPAAVVGATIAISGAPDDRLNGAFVVRRIRHTLDQRRGFLTTIGFSRAAGSSAGGGLGGLA